MQLFDAYMPLVTFAALFRDTPELAGASHDTVRADVNRLLTRAGAACADVPAEGRREALFAVCAFVDEALLTSAWNERGAWARQTLQRTCLGTVNAGVEFYEHARALIRAAGDPGMLPEPAARATAGAAADSAGAAVDLTHLLALGSTQTRAGAESAASAAQPLPAPAPASAASGAGRTRKGALPLTTLPGLSDRDRAAKTPATAVPPWREDALALYGACMSMGFLGRYHDPDEREHLWQTARASLERALGGRVPAGERRLTPESYYMREAGGPGKGLPWRWRLPLILTPLILTLTLFAVYDHVLAVYVSQWLAALTGGQL